MLFYNLLLTLLSPIWVPWMLIRTARRREKPNWNERCGNYSFNKGDRRRIWVHAVSVGEVVAAMPILKELRRELPVHEIVLSVTTSSGHETAREKASDLYDRLVYFPIDVPRFQLAAMQRVRPDVVAIMETELWLNFLWAAKVFGARTLLINGRISDRSYPRSLKIRFFYKGLLRRMDRCLMQSETDVERIESLGARTAEAFGNCKFDQAFEDAEAEPAFWRRELGLASAPVVVVGSLRAEEFSTIGPALRELASEGVQVIVAPRHLERTDELEAVLGDSCARRSRSESISQNLLLLDTYGELSQVYVVADVVVIGGGFANLGGQNPLQPLAHGKPVLHGPYMQNFRDVTALADASGASEVCAHAEELIVRMRALLADPGQRQRMGAAAESLIREHRGASRRYAAAIAEETRKMDR